MEKVVLKNGLRVALEYRPEAFSAAISIYVAAGNRYENEKNKGVSHFVEHMVFKGTTTRTTDDIARESDAMGGQLNAYTAKELTCFYSRALTEQVGKTLHLMCDMLCNPRFDKKDIETEKGVVLEEIGMYEDSPEDLCSDMLAALCYRKSSLGYNILGTRASVSSMTPDVLRGYMEQTYVPERIVVSLCGKFDRSEVLSILEEYFGQQKNTENPIKHENVPIEGGITLKQKEAEQMQVSFCYNGLPYEHELRSASAFFSSVLGGAASSRLNRRIREELGLAYSAYSFLSNYLGTGVFGISAGLAPKNQERFFHETAKIIKQTADALTEEEIALTKEQFKTNIVLSSESMSSIAASAGRQLLLKGSYNPLDVRLEKLGKITLEQVKHAAAIITDPSVIALSVVGDVESEEFYKKMLTYFKI